MECCFLQQACEADILSNQRSKFWVQKYMEGGENTSAKWYFYLFKSRVLAIFETKLLSIGQGIAEIYILGVKIKQDFPTI